MCPEGHHNTITLYVPTPSVAYLILLDEQLLILIRVHIRIGLVIRLGILDIFDELLEVLGDDGTILAAASDVSVFDVLFLDLPLLAELSSTGRELQTDTLLGCGSRGLEVLHILQQNLALRTGAHDLGDVDAVVARELLSSRRGIDLSLLRTLRELLEILDANLVTVGSALETIRHLNTLRIRKLFRCLAREARDHFNLGGLGELLGQEGLLREELDSSVPISGLVLQELVDDGGEGLRRGRHEYRVCVSVSCYSCAPLYAAKLRLY